MEDQGFEDIPFLSNVGMMLTYKCTIACSHCIVKAGPNRKEEMLLEDAFRWIDELRSYRNGYIRGISLTGGEPFYNVENLAAISSYAANRRFVVSVVSNAYWAETREEALRVLSRCSSIQMLSVSADVGHQAFIPLANVRNAIWAAKKRGILYDIAVATPSEEDVEYLRLRDELLDFVDEDQIHVTVTLPVGRASETMDDGQLVLSSEPSKAACSMASYPIIFPNGNVIACIGPPITLPAGHPLFLGNLKKESLSALFDRSETNIILHAIRTFGPRVLVNLLLESRYAHLLPRQYVEDATCDVCFRLFSSRHIVEALTSLIADPEFINNVAYGRNYFLGEKEMLGLIQ